MADFGGNSYDGNNRAEMHKVDHKRSRSQQDSSSEVMDLFRKFSLWREESQAELSNIIKSYNKCINQGFYDLVKEVCDLQTKLSAITKERDYLLDTRRDMNSETKHLVTKSPIPKTLPEVKESPYINNVKEKYPGVEFLHIKEECEEKLGANNEMVVEQDPISFGDIEKESVDQHGGYLLNNQDDLKDSTLNTVGAADPYKIEEAVKDEQVLSDQKRKMKTAEMELVQVSNTKYKNRDPDNNFKCGLCPFVTIRKHCLQRHLEGVHEKIKNHVCKFCGNAFLQKSTLNSHIKSVHEKLRNHVCEECGYAASHKGSITKHMDFVHKMGEKRFMCEQCPYASYQVGNLKKHIETMHEKKPKIRNFICEMCGYTATNKGLLKRHWESVHEGGDKLKCGHCSHETNTKRNLRRHVHRKHLDVSKETKENGS